jgi:OTU domain-containing protein 6
MSAIGAAAATAVLALDTAALQLVSKRHKERLKAQRVAANSALSGLKGEAREQAEAANLEAAQRLEAELAEEMAQLQLGQAPAWLAAPAVAPAAASATAPAKAVPLQKSGKPMTKAQLKHLKMREEAKDAEAKEVHRKQNEGPSERELEVAQIAKRLAKNRLKIKEVEADGHCLYRSVANQLAQSGNGAVGQGTAEGAHMLLRSMCANYMKSHRPQFEPFIAAEDAAEDAPPISFDKYIDRIKNSAEWGGQLELQALAGALKTPIRIVAGDADPLVIGAEFKGEPLVVTYHRHFLALGEHYNSVEPDLGA